MAAGMVAVLGTALVATAPSASAAGTTGYSQPNDIFIPASGSAGPASAYPSVINVAGGPGTAGTGVITDVNVIFSGFSHTFPDDLDIMLQSPTGDKVMLMSDAGGPIAIANTVTWFLDGFPAIPDGGPIAGGFGIYGPSDYEFPETLPAPAPAGPYSTDLNAFNGDIARGDWKLWISDDTLGDSGSLSQWDLNITTTTGTQSISWSPPSPRQVGTTHQATGTAINNANGGPSGVPVTYARNNALTTNDACTVTSGGLITFNHPGNCSVDASAGGNNDFSAATTINRNITVTKGTQTITFTTAPPVPAMIGGIYNAHAVSNGGPNPVTYSVGGLTTNGACTVNNVTGQVTFLNNGVCEVAANQAGDEDWLQATQVSQIINVQKTAQTITWTNPPGPTQPTIGSTFQITATGGGSGNPITYTSNTPGVCTVNSTGLVTFTGVGNCQIKLDQAGNANFSAAPSLLVNLNNVKNGQTIDTSTMPHAGFKGWTVQMIASGGGSGNPVTYASSTPAVCTTTPGGLVTYLNGGTCTLQLNQAGDANNHPAATVNWNINVFGF